MDSSDRCVVWCFVVIGLTISSIVAGCTVTEVRKCQLIDEMAEKGYSEVVESLLGQPSPVRSWKKIELEKP